MGLQKIQLNVHIEHRQRSKESSLLPSFSLNVNEALPLQAQQAIKNETARAKALNAFSEKCSITNIKVAGDLLVCKQVR